jgi:hypothetical protein
LYVFYFLYFFFCLVWVFCAYPLVFSGTYRARVTDALHALFNVSVFLSRIYGQCIERSCLQS